MAEEKRYDVLDESTFGIDWEREVRAFSLDDLIDAFRRTGLEAHRLDLMSQKFVGEAFQWSEDLSVEKGKVAHLEGEVERITAQRDEAIDKKMSFQMRLSDSQVEIRNLKQLLVDASNKNLEDHEELQLVQGDRDTLQSEKDKAEHLTLVARGEA